MRLFHFSEEPGIGRFVPRPAKSRHHTIQEAVVWAIAEEGQWAYLVPRHCPRVTFWAQETSSAPDIDAYLCGDPETKVIAIETAWFERCLSTTLFRYEFKTANFSLHDPIARYYLSRHEEVPIGVVTIHNPLLELARLGVEVRVTPSLWELRERIYRSSLAWGFIRMNNATAPRQGYDAYLPI